MNRVPERTERALAAAVVPDARGDDATPARHAAHLAQAGDRVAHEVDDELRKRGGELVLAEWQLLGRRAADVDARVPRLRRSHELLGRLHGRNVLCSDTADELGDQGAGPAADIQHAHRRLDTGEVAEERRERPGVLAHEPVVRVRGAGEHETKSKRRGHVRGPGPGTWPLRPRRYVTLRVVRRLEWVMEL